MKLNYKTYGDDGPALIILHGLFGELANWHSLSTQFGERYRVFALDQRNHGRSPHHERFDYDVMEEDLLEFLADQGLDKVSLLGHSMGGKTAMFFAVRHPELMEKLIVVDMSVKAMNSGFEGIYEALLSLPVAELKGRQEADDVLAERLDSFEVRQFLLKNLERRSEGGFQWKMNLELICRKHKNIQVAVPDEHPFRGPTLFIRGGDSAYIKDVDFPDFLKIFPAAEFATIDGAGHWVHAEKPEELCDLVIKFLSRG